MVLLLPDCIVDEIVSYVHDRRFMAEELSNAIVGIQSMRNTLLAESIGGRRKPRHMAMGLQLAVEIFMHHVSLSEPSPQSKSLL